MSRALRVYLPELCAGLCELPREQAHYVLDVHRLGAGSALTLFDPEACLEASALVVEVQRGRVRCQVEEPARARSDSLGISLLQAVAKGERLEHVVRAGTALGVERVLLVTSERSVAQPREYRHERLRAVAIDAARQSGRADLPELAGPLALRDALAEVKPQSALKLCFSPLAERPLADFVRAWRAPAPALLLIGPEGGLAQSELDAACDAGFELARLGHLVLRSELAATAALACFAGSVATR